MNPGVPMHADAARITGICDAALVHAPKLATASIVKMFKDPRLVGYNSEAFDRPILEPPLDRGVEDAHPGALLRVGPVSSLTKIAQFCRTDLPQKA